MKQCLFLLCMMHFLLQLILLKKKMLAATLKTDLMAHH